MDVPFHQHNSAAKVMKFQTPSSGTESITTATSNRKISSKILPSYGVQSTADSRSESISNEIGIRLKYTPDSAIDKFKRLDDTREGNSTKLLKQSLERIDNAVKRYGNNIEQSEMPSPFQLSHRVQIQNLRDYLQSEETNMPEDYFSVNSAGYFESAQKKQVYSENLANSVVCESENQNIDNFTLGPDQFAKIKVSNLNSKSSRNLIKEFQREAQLRKQSSNRKKRRNISKYPSSDSRFILRDNMQNQLGVISNDTVMMNHNFSSRNTHLSEPRDTVLRQSRVSEPSLRD